MADKKITEYNDGSGQSLDYFVGLLNGEFKNLTRANAKKIIYSALTEALSDLGTGFNRVIGVNGSNNAGLVTNANLIATLMAAAPTTGGVLIATRESDGYPRFRQIDQAASYASQAVGVAVFHAGHLIIIAKDEDSKQWATSNVTGGNTALGRMAAMADFNGKANTDTIITTLGTNAPAATYCRNYYPSNVEANDGNFGAGRWWLPSAGEKWIMWSHLFEINRALTAIGGTPLNRGVWYWTSTELSATYAWHLFFGNGGFSYSGKTDEYRVRPVSAFY